MFKNRPRILLLFFVFLLPILLWGQGSYYNGIDTGSVTFVTDLQSLLYNHTKLAYSTSTIADIVARDTNGTQKVIECVYSGEKFVYTPPMTWGYFSREHTWCHSWMPTYSSTSGPEYSDLHHLFPTNQNNANGVRSNHPLGIVTTPTSSYLEGKYGKNIYNQNVYEPRDSHKGNTARALLYMAVCYNGVSGNDWTFNYLNTVTLPSKNEAPQDLDLLLLWHVQDPPDSFERARNDSVYVRQGNRNPFIDHPEWVDLIDFNTLTKRTLVPLADEPSQYPAGFNTPAITATSITITWSDPAGTVLPSGYVLMANTTNLFYDPVDGTVYSDDAELADGFARVNVSYGTGHYTFTGLDSGSYYSFRLYPYNGNANARNYKTDNFPQTLTVVYSTSGTSKMGASVVVNEYLNASSGSSEWIELLVLHDSLDMRGMKIRDYSNTGSQQNVSNPLLFKYVSEWESVPHGTLIVITRDNAMQEDMDFSDKSVVIKNTNSYFFQTPSSPFDIGGTADAIQIFSASNEHIHALSHGNRPGAIASIPQPKANKYLPSGLASNKAVRFVNTSALYHFSDTTKTDTTFNSMTPGFANDATQLLFIESLLPVQLTSFTASVANNRVHLQWHTATELNNHGFEIERRLLIQRTSGSMNQSSDESMNQWSTIGFIEGHGTTNAPRSYSFIDRSVAGTAAYRLKQIDRDGSFEYSTIVEVTALAPEVFSLEQNYPNPFNPVTTIEYTIPKTAVLHDISLRIYDLLGREIAVLVNEPKSPGLYSVQFDGSALSSGVYYYALRAGTFQAIRKLSLLK